MRVTSRRIVRPGTPVPDQAEGPTLRSSLHQAPPGTSHPLCTRLTPGGASPTIIPEVPEMDGTEPAEFRTPHVLQVGWGAFRATLPGVLAEAGIQRPLLVTDRIVRNLGSITEAVEALSPAVRFAAVFDEI